MEKRSINKGRGDSWLRDITSWIFRIVIHTTLCAEWTAASQIYADPPSKIWTDDPGYLGLLDISWQPPASLNNSQCSARYELHHYDTNEQRWKSIRTKLLTYRAAFDLGKNIDIKVRTYLKGACTDEKEVWSEWVQLSYLMPVQGTLESSVRDFRCINDNFETLRCEWNKGWLSNNSDYELQYWQEGMLQKKTCDHYLKRNGLNSGCVFRSHQFKMFSDVFMCVTGVSGSEPIRSSYFQFQLQNVGKPGSPEDINITRTDMNTFILDWRSPKGNVPPHCLKYEIQYRSQTDSWKSVTEQSKTTSIIRTSSAAPDLCARIRAKTHTYCTDDGYWSDWSPETCWEESTSLPEIKWIYCIVAAVIILSGILVMTALCIVWRGWSKKIQDKAKELVY